MTAEYMLSESAQKTLPEIDNVLGHKVSLNKSKRIKFIENVSSGHNRIKVEINNRKLSGKSPDLWKV